MKLDKADRLDAASSGVSRQISFAEAPWLPKKSCFTCSRNQMNMHDR